MKQRVSEIIRSIRRRIRLPLRFRAYRKALRARHGFAKVRCCKQILWHEYTLAIRWWRVNDQRYRWRWRAANGILAFIILFGIALPIIQQLLLDNRYHLSADTMKLVGASDQKLQDQLQFSDGNYQFNQAALGRTGPMRAQAGSSTGKGNDTSTYALTVPQDFAKGTTYSDVNTDQSFQLIPQFNGNPVKEVDGHLVIPIDGAQAIYTLKGNGLKEDVVLPHATKDVMSFSYTLKLPNTLEAKVIPDSNGAIGIYSADPTLFGNISATSATDQAALQKARETSDKTNLVFGIPSPVIKTLDGRLPAATSARFSLQGNTLSVIASGLSQIRGAFTIDPSVVVTSASDFQTGGNNESMISFDTTNNQITRGNLTGGSLATTTGTPPSVASTGTLSSATTTSAVINVPAGVVSGSLVIAHVWVAWGTSTTPTSASITGPSGWSFAYGAAFHDTADSTWAYAGWYYKYATGADTGTYTFTVNTVGGTSALGGTGISARITGGPTSGNPFSDTLQTSSVTNGSPTIASFTPGANYTLLLAGHDTLAQGTGVTSFTPPTGWTVNQHDGFVALESVGQSTATATGTLTFASTGNADYNWASVAAIRGTTTGGWSTNATSFSGTRYADASVAYNGYAYVIGGYNGTSRLSDVQYAPINSDGSIGSWTSTTALGSGNQGSAAVAYNGYLYVFGGYDGSSYLNTVQYAPINSNGTLGTWSSASSFTTPRGSLGAVAYNGYVYIMGGSDSSSTYSDVQYAPVQANGTLGSWTSTTSFTNGREGLGAVAYNGYVYVAGGYSSGTYYNDTQYAHINSDGTVGSWTSTTSFTTAREYHQMLTYNGYVYILDGTAGSSSLSDVQYAQLNANGTVGSWTSTTSLGNGFFRAGAAAYNGYLYTFGGKTDLVYTSTTQYTKINPEGVTGSFASATSLPSSYAVNSSCTVAANGYIYELGGLHAGSAQSTVYYAAINSDTTLGTWATTTSLPAAIYSEGCTATNGYIYVIGGYTGSAGVTSVYYAAIGSGGTISSWSSYTGTGTGALPTSIYNAGVTISGNYLYVVGGSGLSTSAVNFAQISPSGGLVTTVASCPASGTLSHATWCSTSSLPSGRVDTNAVASGGYIYEVAGYTGSAASATVYYAAVNSNGTLGAWQTSAQNLPTAVYWPSIVTNKGYIYVIGGYTGSTTVTNVYYAPISSSGDIGAWQTALPLAVGQYEASAAVYGDTIYDVAGYTTGPQYTVQSAPINNGGSGMATGSWSYNGSSLSTARSAIASAVYNGYLYLLGGKTSSWQSSTLYAKLNDDGSLGSWQTATNTFTGVRGFAGAIAYNGYLYVLGGSSDGTSTNTLSDVQYAAINSDGSLGTWASTTSLATGVSIAGFSEYKGYMYAVGGQTALATSTTVVQYAAVNSNGTLGTWATSTALPSSLVGVSAIAYAGHLYALGGSVGASAVSNATYYATINATGTIGSWTATTSMQTARRTALAMVYDGFIYMTGGYNSSDDSTNVNTVEYAPVLSNGTLGSWTYTSSMTNSRHGQGGGIANGRLYLVGGSDGTNNGSTSWSDAQSIGLNNMARTAAYSRLISLGSSTNLTSITYNGTVPGGNAAVTYQVAGADGILGSASPTATASGSGNCIGNTVGAYYVRVNVLLDDSAQGGSGTFPDGTSNANLTDFTVSYNAIHPAPNIRLRLGQTLQSGTLSPFDTCSSVASGGNGHTVVAIPSGGTSYATSNGTNPLVLNKPSGTADGDLLICAIFDRSTNTESFPALSGWTALSNTGTIGTSGGVGIYYMPVTSASSLPSSWSVTLASTRTVGFIFRVTGANLAFPIASAGSYKAFGSDGSDTNLGSVTVPTNGAAIAIMGSFWTETADTTSNNALPGLTLQLTATNPASGTGRASTGAYVTTTSGATGNITPGSIWTTNGSFGRLFAINPY